MAISAMLLGVRHFRDRGVGDQRRCVPRASTSDTPITRWPGLGSMQRAHVLERDREVAGDAGDHGVGVAQRDHAGGEVVAVGVDQPLAVAEQIASALQPLVEIVAA